MAGYYVQEQGPSTSFAAGPSTTKTQAYGGNTITHDLLYCVMAWDSAATCVVTDAANGTWTALTQITNGTHHLQFFYVLSCTGAVTPTITATFSPVTTATNIQITVGEYTVPAAAVGSVALDAHDETATGTGTVITSTTIAPTNNPYELIIIYADGAVVSLTWTVGTGSVLETSAGPSASIRTAVEDQLLAGTVGVFGTFIISASNAWCCGIVSFQPGLPTDTIAPQITGGYHDMGGAIANTNTAFCVGGGISANTNAPTSAPGRTNSQADSTGDVAPQVGQVYPWSTYAR